MRGRPEPISRLIVISLPVSAAEPGWLHLSWCLSVKTVFLLSTRAHTNTDLPWPWPTGHTGWVPSKWLILHKCCLQQWEAIRREHCQQSGSNTVMTFSATDMPKVMRPAKGHCTPQGLLGAFDHLTLKHILLSVLLLLLPPISIGSFKVSACLRKAVQ